MPRETEIKLPVLDVKALERKLKRLGAKTLGSGSGRVHEMNVIFDTPEGGLAKHGQLLRIRTEAVQEKSKTKLRNRVLVTFKQPVSHRVNDEGARFKIREESEVEVADAAQLTRIFEGLGLRGWFAYEKYRTTWKLGATARWAKDLLIEVDQTPVGTYVELEGPPQAIDRAAAQLGYTRKDYLLKNYLTLYAEDCRRRGIPPGNMLFPSGKSEN
jgi:adenylate cyclase class 2